MTQRTPMGMLTSPSYTILERVTSAMLAGQPDVGAYLTPHPDPLGSLANRVCGRDVERVIAAGKHATTQLWAGA